MLRFFNKFYVPNNNNTSSSTTTTTTTQVNLNDPSMLHGLRRFYEYLNNDQNPNFAQINSICSLMQIIQDTKLILENKISYASNHTIKFIEFITTINLEPSWRWFYELPAETLIAALTDHLFLSAHIKIFDKDKHMEVGINQIILDHLINFCTACKIIPAAASHFVNSESWEWIKNIKLFAKACLIFMVKNLAKLDPNGDALEKIMSYFYDDHLEVVGGHSENLPGVPKVKFDLQDFEQGFQDLLYELVNSNNLDKLEALVRFNFFNHFYNPGRNALSNLIRYHLVNYYIINDAYELAAAHSLMVTTTHYMKTEQQKIFFIALANYLHPEGYAHNVLNYSEVDPEKIEEILPDYREWFFHQDYNSVSHALAKIRSLKAKITKEHQWIEQDTKIACLTKDLEKLQAKQVKMEAQGNKIDVLERTLAQMQVAFNTIKNLDNLTTKMIGFDSEKKAKDLKTYPELRRLSL